MTPHALSSETEVCGDHHVFSNQNKPLGPTAGGAHQNGSSSGSAPSFLLKVPKDELHDLICVGFGPASLAVAVALNDAIEFGSSDVPTNFHSSPPKVCFYEKQDHFAWHSGMQLDDAKMQISWVKDLATLRTPRSRFTFLSYLHAHGRLVAFTNLGTFTPLRVEYEAYMRWCATAFENVVQYHHEGVEVIPVKMQGSQNAPVDAFEVRTRNLKTGAVEIRVSRNVILALGGKPRIPPALPQHHPRVLHSSNFNLDVPRLLPDYNKPYKLVVIGAGQSAAETFNALQTRYPNSHTRLVIRSGALKPSDDSPFVNEIFDPDRVDTTYSATAAKRAADLATFKTTNYGVVQADLLEHLYAQMYKQRLRHARESDWPHRILTYRDVTGISDVADSGSTVIDEFSEASAPIRVHLINHESSNARKEALAADLVIVASGYTRNAHENMLQATRHLLPTSDPKVKDSTFKVSRDYRVQYAKGAVTHNAGIWLQGCNEETHGLSDSLLSVLATRSGEVVRSIFGSNGATG